jgi:hypothetical protein
MCELTENPPKEFRFLSDDFRLRLEGKLFSTISVDKKTQKKNIPRRQKKRHHLSKFFFFDCTQMPDSCIFSSTEWGGYGV